MRKRPREYDREEELDDLPYQDNDFSVVSSCECTGLIAEIPLDETETESYKVIYDIPLEPYTGSEEIK